MQMDYPWVSQSLPPTSEIIKKEKKLRHLQITQKKKKKEAKIV